MSLAHRSSPRWARLNYRLVVKARYRYGIVLTEWVGTHAEYDKQLFQGQRK